MTSQAAVVAIIDALEAASITYMLVGSFSTNFHGIPRSTRDADFVVQLQGAALQQLFSNLSEEFEPERQVEFETITGTIRHLIRLKGKPFKIELFQLSDDPHDRTRFDRRIQGPIEGRAAFIATAEDAIITKLRWLQRGARGKDRDDVRDVLSVQADALDWDYVHHWCDDHGTRELLDEILASIPKTD